MNLRQNFLKSVVCFFTIIAASSNVFAQESDFFNKTGAIVGASLEIGGLGNSGMNLKNRTMSSFALEALPGYQYDSQWFFGVDLNYRILSQLTTVSSAGDTNLKGKSWLLGLGAQYKVNETCAVLAALDFVGQYDFDKQTSGGKDDHLYAPISLKVKGQYYFDPQWTADVSVNYTRWSKFHVGGANQSESSNQWLLGGGVSYHFSAAK